MGVGFGFPTGAVTALWFILLSWVTTADIQKNGTRAALQMYSLIDFRCYLIPHGYLKMSESPNACTRKGQGPLLYTDKHILYCFDFISLH